MIEAHDQSFLSLFQIDGAAGYGKGALSHDVLVLIWIQQHYESKA